MSDIEIAGVQYSGVPSITVPKVGGGLAEYVEGSQMVVLSYGSSTWQDFLDAYDTNTVVYCRASSNTNPATGSQNRMAFMAYVNGGLTPTSVEFQYYRSVNQHTASQQGDQVYIYQLTSAGVWSVTVRECSAKIVAGTDISANYSNGTMTIGFSGTIPSTASDVGAIAAPASPATGAFLVYDGSAWVAQTLSTWQNGGSY